MLYPDLISNQAKIRHQEMIEEAEAWRRAHQFKGTQPGLVQRGRGLLAVITKQLKSQKRPQSSSPAFRTK